MRHAMLFFVHKAIVDRRLFPIFCFGGAERMDLICILFVLANHRDRTQYRITIHDIFGNMSCPSFSLDAPELAIRSAFSDF